MKIIVNGSETDVTAERLDAVLDELGHGGAVVATALNQRFVARAARAGTRLEPGDRLEIVSPRQGG